jgi:hypothetical protein
MIFSRTSGDDDFHDWLDGEFAWRRRELLHHETLVRSAKPPNEAMTIRSAIPMLYAHWEGFVRAAGTAYLDFVLSRGKNFEQLKANFLALGMKGHLMQAESSLKAKVFTQACSLVLTQRGRRAYFITKDAVDTRMNLTFEIFDNICVSLGIVVRPEYEGAKNTIIDPVLGFRNTVAHGKELLVSRGRYLELHAGLFDIMNLFRNDLDNAVTMKSYIETTVATVTT